MTKNAAMKRAKPSDAANAVKLADEQLRILRHMLGIDTRFDPRPVAYRDYYCANPGNPELHELQRLGMVRLYAERDGYEWFTTTDGGKAAARASQQAMLEPKSKRVYRKWLSVRDCFADLRFFEFLTDPMFADTRKAA